MITFGRTVIKSDAIEVTAENLIRVLQLCNPVHLKNAAEITYLYDYYKGKQPVLEREKEVRPEICNRIVVNIANEIVSFKVGYLAGEPVQYISRNGSDTVSKEVSILNDMMLLHSKHALDKEVIEWNTICGTAYRIVLPNKEEEDAPFEVYTIDPRDAFVIYSSRIEHKPLAGVYLTHTQEGTKYTVYTRTRYFECMNMQPPVIAKPNPLGMIPIVEYPANTARLGAFEPVLGILDAINTVTSNRVDGIEQFIQSLTVLYNCELPEGTTANTIREYGLVTLNDVDERKKADLKILSQELNQQQTQTLIDYMYDTILRIVGMPSQSTGSTSDSSNNGAVILKNGWQSAEARAKDAELMFKQSERSFLKILLRILWDLSDLTLKSQDIDFRFTRRCYEDILSKSQVLTTMLATDKIDPQLAFNVCGLFTDPEEAYLQSMEWYEKQTEEPVEEEVTDDRPNQAEV